MSKPIEIELEDGYYVAKRDDIVLGRVEDGETLVEITDAGAAIQDDIKVAFEEELGEDVSVNYEAPPEEPPADLPEPKQGPLGDKDPEWAEWFGKVKGVDAYVKRYGGRAFPRYEEVLQKVQEFHS